MIENNAVRTWRSTTNMHGDRRHQRSDWAAHRKRKVEEVSGSRSPAICSDPSNQKSTWFKLASCLKQAEHPRQPLLNGSERNVAILFTPWVWFYSSPGTGDWVAGPVPESLLVKVSAKKILILTETARTQAREFLVFLHRVAESFSFLTTEIVVYLL